VDDQIDRASQRLTLTYRVIPRLSLGVEVNPKADEVGPLLNLVVLNETEKKPAVLFGISSDRIGTPDGTAYFATVSKNFEKQLKWPISPYVGIAYGTYDDEMRAIGGLYAGLGGGFSSTMIYDGHSFHPTVGYRFLERHVITALWVDTRNIGFAYSIAF
jgi:hypothetical protein